MAQSGTTPPDGYTSGSRDLLLEGTAIVLTNADDTGVSTHEWSIDYPPHQEPGAYVVTGLTGPTCTITPPASPDGYGDIKVRLVVTGPCAGRMNVDVQEIILGIPKPIDGYAPGYPVPHPKEGGAGTSATLSQSHGAMGRVNQLALAVLQEIAAGGGGGGGGTTYPRPIQAVVAADANVDVHDGPTTIQAISCVANDIVLLTAQADPAENGLWTVVADDWIRHPSCNSTQDIYDGILVQIQQGTYAEKLFILAWEDGAPGNVLGTDEITAVQVSPSQSLRATDSPTFAGLTLTGFSGILKATAGVLSAAALALSDLPTGSAGTVLTGTGAAPAYSATPVLTAVKDAGTNPATTGFVRASNATTVVAARNAANNANWSLVGTDENGIIFGAASGPSVSILSAGDVVFGTSVPHVGINSSGILLLGNDATGIYGGSLLGNPFEAIRIENGDITLGTGLATAIFASMASGGSFGFTAGSGAVYLYPAANAQLLAYSLSTSMSYGFEDRSTNGVTGALASFLGQNCTGTTSTGGSIYLGSGSGTSANGEVQFGTGGTTRLTLSATGKSLTFAAALTTAVTLTQADLATNSATGARLDILAQSCTGTSSVGGELRLGSGAGTSRAGYITFYRGATLRGQIGSGSVTGGTWFGNSNTASGLHSFCAGASNTASNDYGIALGVSNSSTATASAAVGSLNSIGGSSDYAAAIGLSNSVQATSSVALGAYNTINNGYGVALGFTNTVSAVGSVAHGLYATTSTYGEIAHGSGNAPGTPQNSRAQVSGVTTATASTNVDLKAGGSADQEITTRSDRIYLVEVRFTATSASFTLVGGITLRNALIKNTSGTVTVIDQGDQESTATTPADWVIALSGSGASLRVNFSKTADATALRCSAVVTLVEVAKA